MHSHNVDLPIRPAKARDGVYREFYHHSAAPRVNTDEVITEAIRKQYPELSLTTTPSYSCNLLGYAQVGLADAIPTDTESSISASLIWKVPVPPFRRTDTGLGFIAESIQFGKYLYTWKDQEFLVYIVVGSRGLSEVRMTYILGVTEEATESLMLTVSKWMGDLKNEVLVFDGGYWQKSAELWRNVQNSFWSDVILDAEMKKTVIGVIDQFFNAKEKYQKLKVPWKRGIIFYGPPGNGKTISIKAMMHSLYERLDPIPTLYVRSLSSYGGPEYAISSIFNKARQMAPCFLVFEDLDSIITDAVRSYFLNEVDGLKSNDGILMLGSTNHLERLDPGISKRPSRFDRKYCFSNPSLQERVQYCEFWRTKLSENEDIEFPTRLNKAIASITKDFSFAYIQEAFVASLLEIAGGEEGTNDGGDDFFSHVFHASKLAELTQDLIPAEENKDLDEYVLWRQMKKQVRILRDELEAKE